MEKEYFEARMRDGRTVRVYDITNGVATIFDEYMFLKQNNGFVKVSVGKLVPMGYPLNSDGFMTKTKRNKAKSRLKIVEAIWESTDGKRFDHKDLNEAIEYEFKLMESEKDIDITTEANNNEL